MKLPKLRKLNALGMSHLMVPIIAVVAIGGIGTYLLGVNHADPLTSSSSLLFVDNGTGYIYSRQANGTVKKLVYGLGPTYINNGTQILYYEQSDGIYVMNADGSNPRRIISADVSAFSWSEASKEIVYSAYEDPSNLNANVSLYVADLSGKTTKIYNSGTHNLATPEVSPDGKRIVFQTNGSSNGSILAVITKSGTNYTELPSTAGGSIEFNPLGAWAPDSQRVVYHNDAVHIVSVVSTYQDTVLYKTSNKNESFTDAVWSPDGSRIAFSDQIYGKPAKLQVIPVTGGKPTQLTSFATNTSNGLQLVEWSSDSTQLAAVSHLTPSTTGMYLVDLNKNKSPINLNTFKSTYWVEWSVQ